MVRPDGCPYRRPFSEYFADCPAYEPEVFAPTNTRDVPMTPVWSCIHLTVGDDEAQRGHFFAKCMVGDAAARRALLFRRIGWKRIA